MPEVEAKPAAEIPADPPEFDRAALESTVASSMADVFGDDDAPAEEAPAEEAAAAEGEEKVITDEEKEAAAKGEVIDDNAEKKDDEVVEEEAAAAGEKPADKAADLSKVPTLPAAYIRSLKTDGWTDQEIAEHAKVPGFLNRAGAIHDRRNAETARWAEAGRQERARLSAQQDANKGQNVFEALKPVDSAALKKQYGEDALIDALTGPVNAQIERMNSLIPVLQQVQQRSQSAELETLSRQIEGFFGGAEMKSYAELYGGSDFSKLNEKQIETRNKVLETADALVVGAKLQGRTMSLNDALTLAHDSVSGGYKAQAARTTIKKELKTRERGISLRPGNRGSNISASGAGKVNSRGDLEAKVSAGLKSVFA